MLSLFNARTPRFVVLLIVVSLALIAKSYSQTQKFVNDGYEVVKVADGVYSFVSSAPYRGTVQSNCTLVIGDESALLVDSGQFPSLAEKMALDIRKLTTKPLRYLVNTSWHLDHAWGNATIKQAFPEASIISTEFARDMIAREGAASNDVALLRARAAEQRKAAASGKTSSGVELRDDQRALLLEDAEALDHIVPEREHTRNLPPSETFDSRKVIDLGGRKVELLWLGRASSAGDVIAWVPDVKVVAAGDVVVSPVPFAADSYIAEWADVLDKIAALKPSAIVPGHGAIMHDDHQLKTAAAMFREVVAQVQRDMASGLTAQDARRKVNLDAFRRKFGDNPYALRDFRAFLNAAVPRAYEQAQQAQSELQIAQAKTTKH